MIIAIIIFVIKFSKKYIYKSEEDLRFWKDILCIGYFNGKCSSQKSYLHFTVEHYKINNGTNAI